MVARRRVLLPLLLLALALLLALLLAWLLMRTPAALSDCLQSQQGLWSVCERSGRVHFGVPRELLGRELVVVKTRFENGNLYAHGPAGTLLARWAYRDGVLVLETKQATQRLADAQGALLDDRQRALPWEATARLQVLSGRWFGDITVDATALFTTAVETWFAGGVASDAVAAQVDEVRSFPLNVIVKTVGVAGAGGPSSTTLTDWNFVLLPEKPMQPRLWDARSPHMWPGFYSWGEVPAPGQPEVMLRWRLEKKHPGQAVSEPVQPIVVYIDPATPDKWKPFMRRAIEAWSPAFEAAGFRNAVVAREVSPDDKAWSRDDVRYTVLEWFRDDVPTGEHAPERMHFYSRLYHERRVFDPRTGEFLQHSIGSRNRYPDSADPYLSWTAKYFVRAGATDPRVDQFPLDDELRGEMIQGIATHEMGHTLGLVDGSFGKGVYTVAQVRDPAWVRRNGYTPSVMNYTRMNYVAQPEDGMPAELLQQQVGPADHYWMQVAHEVFPNAGNAWAEQAPMEVLLGKLDRQRELRFNRTFLSAGPDSIMEAVEVDDPVEASRLGLLNLQRAIGKVRDAASRGGIGRANVPLIEAQALAFWKSLMSHPVSMVGGYTQYRRAGHQTRAVATRVPAQAQRAAVAFLVREAFATPRYLRDPALTQLLPTEPAPTNDLAVIRSLHKHVLDQLVGAQAVQRLYRLAESELGYEGFAVAEGPSYPLTEFLADVRQGVWSELDAGRIAVDPFRQGLQELHLQALRDALAASQADPTAVGMPPKLAPKLPLDSFLRNAIAAELHALGGALQAAEARSADPVTAAHLRRMRNLALQAAG